MWVGFGYIRFYVAQRKKDGKRVFLVPGCVVACYGISAILSTLHGLRGSASTGTVGILGALKTALFRPPFDSRLDTAAFSEKQMHFWELRCRKGSAEWVEMPFMMSKLGAASRR